MSPIRRTLTRELRVELGCALAFAAAALPMAFWRPHGHTFEPELAALLIATMLVTLRVEFDVAEGRTRPVQLVFIPMLVLLPVATVPLVVAGVQVASRLPDVLAGRMPARRTLLAIGDAWFCIPPAILLGIAGPLTPSATGLAVLLSAVALQVGTDLAVSWVRLRYGVGIDPRQELHVFGWIYLVDALLTPVGALAAAAAYYEPLAVLAVLPLAALLVVFARERQGRLQAAIELHRLAEAAEERLQSIVQNSSDLIAVLAADGTIRSLTGAVEPVYGPDWREAVGTPLVARVHPEDVDFVRQFLGAVASGNHGASHEGEWRMLYPDDAWHHVEAAVTNLCGDTRVDGLVMTARDVSERREFEARLRHRAFHDLLTGLANRALFYDRVEHALAREAGGEERRVAVLFVDLDDFKPINDTHGHAAGDDVLVAIAGRLRGSLAAEHTVARLGGDEFGVLLEAVRTPQDAVAVAEQVLGAIAEPLTLSGASLVLQASVGVAISQPGQRGVDELLRHADTAMYGAKRMGKHRWELYDPDSGAPGLGSPEARAGWLLRAEAQRAEIESILQRPGSIHPVYQPILDLRTGGVAGYESLSRFDSAEVRAPSDWFAQAHRCGLGYELEAHAILTALAGAPRHPHAYLSINLSPSSLKSPQVQAVLPQRLEGIVIEVTENELMSDDPEVRAALASLRARGGRVAVDDAGSGYAGLKHVVRLAPDIIKLDRALVERVHEDPVKAALIESFVRYGREIGAAVCAEGIETPEELRRLAELDVAYGQGWFIARPGPPWPSPSEESMEICRLWLAEGCTDTVDFSDASNDRRLESLMRMLAGAQERDAIHGSLEPIARELCADDIELCPPGEDRSLVQVVASDPAADPMRTGVLAREGFQAELRLPVDSPDGTLALLRLRRRDPRPWTRFEVRRALIISYQLAAALERVRAPA